MSVGDELLILQPCGKQIGNFSKGCRTLYPAASRGDAPPEPLALSRLLGVHHHVAEPLALERPHVAALVAFDRRSARRVVQQSPARAGARPHASRRVRITRSEHHHQHVRMATPNVGVWWRQVRGGAGACGDGGGGGCVSVAVLARGGGGRLGIQFAKRVTLAIRADDRVVLLLEGGLWGTRGETRGG